MLMKTIKLHSYVGADGTLHLDVPVGMKDTESDSCDRSGS
jgi:hypothetical protein